MASQTDRLKFAKLFKRYRLRSEIETLAEFGDLLAEEGVVYENSLFTRWQKGERIPGDRRTIMAILRIFIRKRGIVSASEANQFLESSRQGYLTDAELHDLPEIYGEEVYQAPLANLGELLRRYRIQKNISKQEVALALGLDDLHIIDHIETGFVERPDRKTIDKFCNALKLSIIEKNNLLLVGNYLPSKKDMEVVREKVKSEIECWPYSAILYDFCWRVIYINKKHAELLGISEIERQKLHMNTPPVIEIIFDPHFIANNMLKGKDLEAWHNNLLRFIIHFRSFQNSIIQDKWYMDLIKKMMKNKLFQQIWQRANSLDNHLLTTRMGRKVFFGQNSKKSLQYNIFVVPLFEDPRFEIEFANPANLRTFEYFSKSS